MCVCFVADAAFLSEPGKREVKSLRMSVLCVPASTWIRLFIPVSSCAFCLVKNTNCRAATTNLIIKIVSYLQYRMMKPFAMGCFGRSAAWKCLHGQSEGDLDGWVKIQPWAPAWQYVSVPWEPHEVHQEHPREQF